VDQSYINNGENNNENMKAKSKVENTNTITPNENNNKAIFKLVKLQRTIRRYLSKVKSKFKKGI